MLVVFSGLPGVGKSALAREVARQLSVAWLSVDPIESAIVRAGIAPSFSTGLAAYLVAEAVADAQLANGLDVIVDAVNGVEPARAAWRALAAGHGTPLRIVECVCSDRDEHRRRVEGRQRGVPGVPDPTWEQVEARRGEYLPWTDERLVVDTTEPLPDLTRKVLGYLGPGRP